MDIADFVEEICGIKLLDYQKKYIRELYKNPGAIIFPRTRSFPYWYTCYLASKDAYDEMAEKMIDAYNDLHTRKE